MALKCVRKNAADNLLQNVHVDQAANTAIAMLKIKL